MPTPTLIAHQRRELKFEVRSLAETKDANGIPVGRCSGYASVFGKVDHYDDIVAAGAFTKTLQERPKVKVLWQHNPSMPIGAPTAMREDGYGLLVDFDLNLEVEKGREAYSLLKQGAIDGISIGFETLKDEMDRESGIRTIKEVRLWEFSVVTFQAQEAAMVTSIKNLDDKGAAAVVRYERAKLGIRDLGNALGAGLKSKDFAATTATLKETIEELKALEALLPQAAEVVEPAESHSASELKQMQDLIELMKL